MVCYHHTSLAMSCTVAISSSPVFSPSRRPLSCKVAVRPFVLRTLLREEASPVLPQPVSAAVAASAPEGPMLKRRRLAPLVVPAAGAAAAAAVAVAAAVAAVEADPRNKVEEGEEFAAYCRRGKGRRVEIEDRHVAKAALGRDPHVSLFGVFDGHCEKSAAEFAAKNMPKFMAEELKKAHNGEIEGAVKRGYLKMDEEFLKTEESGGACCATAVLRKGGLVVSNAGDCHAVLSRAGKAEALNSDHRASQEDEKDRIENLGGFVVNYCGTWRVQGSLAVSRGIGDAHLKQWVVADPDTRSLLVDQQCEFLIWLSCTSHVVEYLTFVLLVITMRTMQLSSAASWNVSSEPLGLLKGRAMESGTSGDVRERQLNFTEEFLGALIRILVHTLFLGLGEDNLRTPRAKPQLSGPS